MYDARQFYVQYEDVKLASYFWELVNFYLIVYLIQLDVFFYFSLFYI